ncbi:MAG: hypothetical protein AB1446_07200 [Bacillota bacterium]
MGYKLVPCLLTLEAATAVVEKTARACGAVVRCWEGRLAYLPVWVAHTLCTVRQPFGGTRKLPLLVGADGWSGVVAVLAGAPLFQVVEEVRAEELLLPVRFGPADLEPLVVREAQEYLMSRWRQLSEVSVLAMDLLYRPVWVCLDERRKVRMVDGHTGERLYHLDRMSESLVSLFV